MDLLDLQGRVAVVTGGGTGIGDGTMLRRIGRPDEVAAAIVFLASDAASYITAQTISVDGGHSMGGIPDT